MIIGPFPLSFFQFFLFVNSFFFHNHQLLGVTIMIYKIMRVLHFSLSLTIMIFKIMMHLIMQEHNKDMCKMRRGGGHLNMFLMKFATMQGVVK
jgi:hypothetical protein